MLLSDRDILAEIESNRIVVEPYDETMIQPSSIDFRLIVSSSSRTTRR